MSTTARNRVSPARRDQIVSLRGIGWDGYWDLLRMRGERARPRIIYLDGDAWLMSPGYLHERWAERFGMFVHEVIAGLDIPCTPAGHTTLWIEHRKVGVEADKSFYFTNERAVRNKTDLFMGQDPPPDLAIEAVRTRAAGAAIECYRRLGVPEIWVGRAAGVRFFVRDDEGAYRAATASRSLPFLTPADVTGWILRPMDVPETDWIKALRRWVQTTLAPRIRPNPANP